MRYKKNITVFLFILIIVTAFSACDKKTVDGDETTETATSVVVGNDNTVYEFDEEKLFEVNSMDNLLKMYSTVKIIDKHDGSENIQQFFMYDGKPVFAQKWIGNNGNTLYEGLIKGCYVDYENGQYIASANADDLVGDDAAFPYEDAVINAVSGYEFELIEETEDCFVLNLNYAGKTDDITNTCTVDKKTHVLKSVCYETADGYVATTEYVYGDEVDDFGITQGFDDTKTITVNIHKIKDGKEENKTLSFTVPSAWKFAPSFRDEYTLYADSEYTQIFEYPVHEEDYTIYATNLMG